MNNKYAVAYPSESYCQILIAMSEFALLHLSAHNAACAMVRYGSSGIKLFLVRGKGNSLTSDWY